MLVWMEWFGYVWIVFNKLCHSNNHKLLRLFYQIGQVIMIIESSSIEEVKDVMEGLDRIVYLIEKEKMMKEVK